MKIKWFYWSMLIVVLLAGVTVSVYFGIQPKPVPKIDLSGFESPEEMGASIFKRLRLEMQSASVLFLGVMPDQKMHYQVWNELFQKANEPGWKYDLLVIEKNLPYRELIKEKSGITVEEMDLKEDFARLAEGLKKAKEEKKRVAILAPSIYSTQILKTNLADRLKTEAGLKVVSFSATTFPINADQEKNMETPCVLNQEDRAGSGQLGCMILNVSRPMYRKKKTVGKYPGAVNQVGGQDYLVFFNSDKYF